MAVARLSMLRRSQQQSKCNPYPRSHPHPRPHLALTLALIFTAAE